MRNAQADVLPDRLVGPLRLRAPARARSARLWLSAYRLWDRCGERWGSRAYRDVESDPILDELERGCCDPPTCVERTERWDCEGL